MTYILTMPKDVYSGVVATFETEEEADAYREEHIGSEAWHHLQIYKVDEDGEIHRLWPASSRTGIDFKLGNMELKCPHQSGILYVTPAEASWVCDDQLRAHALAGFFSEFVAAYPGNQGDPGVHDLMQRWGLAYRTRPLGDS